MAKYRLYFINPTPKHIRDIVEFEAEDGRRALQMAAAMADGRAMELWEGDQVIQAFDPGPPPSRPL